MDKLTDLLARLISIPSMNPMGREVSGPGFFEAELSDFLEGWLRQRDLDVRRQPVRPLRENVLATYHSPGSNTHILLEVHQDTVPVDGMVIDPFLPAVDGNRMYGRGACDNKGSMTAMLLALERLAAERPAGAATVTLALTVDEENTFLGAAALVDQGIAADMAIVAEPTDLNIVVAHKGIVRWEIETPGVACHSSAPERGVNAIYRMAPILERLAAYAALLDGRPADPLLGKPTLSVGRVEGGTSVNTVPDFCRIQVDRRLVPGESPEAAFADVNAFIQSHPGVDFPIDFRPPWVQLGPMGNEANGPLAEKFGRSIDALRGGHSVGVVPFGTDAAVFARAGIPSIVFGPGSIQQAHTKDEWVPLDEVARAADIYFDFCASGWSR